MHRVCMLPNGPRPNQRFFICPKKKPQEVSESEARIVGNRKKTLLVMSVREENQLPANIPPRRRRPRDEEQRSKDKTLCVCMVMVKQ